MPPRCTDERLKYVPIGCGNCIECRRQNARNWQVRLHEEIKTECNKYFVTLTFSEENLQELAQLTTISANEIAKYAIRHFLERWRKKYKKSVRHWFITELGEQHGRIHLHGFIFTNVNLTNELLAKIWKYGITYIGNYCTGQTINYVIKYITKIDQQHTDYKPIILASAGIGNRYTTTHAAIANKYRPQQTQEFYRLPNGNKTSLPIYYRNKIYTEEEREKLWIERLDKNTIYLMGNKYNVATEEGRNNYNNALKYYQQKSEKYSYGNGKQDWKYKEYNIQLKKINTSKKYNNLKSAVYKKYENNPKKSKKHIINLDITKKYSTFALSNERKGTLTS